MSGTKLFQKNRALGCVSNHLPASLRFVKKRREYMVVTCVGNSFHIYGANKLHLLSVSGMHPEGITCMASDEYLVYTSSGKIIYGWRMGRIIKYTYKGHEKDVHLMLPFGRHLIAIDDANVMKVWEIRTETTYLDIQFQVDKFKITALMHPSTYLNKILLGSEQGELQMWNIKHGKLIHTFKSFENPITVLEQAPAVDIAAIGLKSGRIVLLNLKVEEVLMEFNQDWGFVTGISFRTDGPAVMATSSNNGKVVIWDLEERKIVSHMKTHSGPVCTLQFFPNEPLLLTTSPDNSVKIWIFDATDGGGRLLRERGGHSKPPTHIRFHGANGHNILSSGEDSTMRIFSTVTETLNKSLGKASYNKKLSKRKNRFEYDRYLMSPIIKFTTETTREKEWDNIAAIHRGLVQTTTWTYNKQRMGDLKLVPPQYHNKNPEKEFNVEATAICLTHCGNFVIIGYSSGYVERFNIQSGIHRMQYGSPAHKKSTVRGIASDQLNQMVISGACDGTIKFWNFNSGTEPFSTISLDYGVMLFTMHRESSMLCVGLEDFSANIIDCEAQNIVRQFRGHTASLTDCCFSADSRWLITAAMDCAIKVWDIPSSYLVDHFRTTKPCISLTMSPTGQFLATIHANDLAIYLWANKTLFNHVSLRIINPESEPPLIDLPTTSEFESEFGLACNLSQVKLEEGDEVEVTYESPEKLDDILITMSAEAASKWQNLLDLEIIRKRNKPKEPLRVPKQAPFFLPTVAGTELQFDFTDINRPDEQSKMLQPTKIDNTATLGKLLKSGTDNDFTAPLKYLKSIGPSMIDFEIKSLSSNNGGSADIMERFMTLLISVFESKLNFELGQAYLGVFLQAHNDEICKTSKLRKRLADLETAQNQGWQVLEDNLLYGIGVVNVIRNYVS